MGNCATKPEVLKDSDEDLIPVERETTPPTDHNKHPSAGDEAAAEATRRSEKGKEILIEDDVEEEHTKRQSLSLLFHEDKAIEKETTNLSRNKSGASSEVSKLDTSALVASNVKAPETSDVQTQNDLEVKIPKDSEVMTPETPKAKEVSKVTKESGYLESFEDKNATEVPKVMTDEVKAAESQLLKVSEVTTSEDLEKQVKTPEPSSIEVGSEVKIDQEATKVKTGEETKGTEFVDAQEKIDRSEAQILEDIKMSEEENVKHKTKEGEKDI